MAGIKWEKETVNGLSSAGKNKKHDLYFQSLDDRERLYKENFEVSKGIVQDRSMTFAGEEKVYASVDHREEIVTIINCMNAHHWGGARAKANFNFGSQEEALIDYIPDYAGLPFYGMRNKQKGYYNKKTQRSAHKKFRYDTSAGKSSFLNMPATLFGPFAWSTSFRDRTDLSIVGIQAPDFRTKYSRGDTNTDGVENQSIVETKQGCGAFAQLIRAQLAAVIEWHIDKVAKGSRSDNTLVLPILGCGAFQGDQLWYAEQYYFVLSHYADDINRHHTKLRFPYAKDTAFEVALKNMISENKAAGYTQKRMPFVDSWKKDIPVSSSGDNRVWVWFLIVCITSLLIGYAAGLTALFISFAVLSIILVAMQQRGTPVNTVFKQGLILQKSILDPIKQGAFSQLRRPAFDKACRHAGVLVEGTKERIQETMQNTQ